MLRARFENAFVGWMPRVGTKIGNKESRGQNLHSRIGCVEIVMKGVICHEHIRAWLFFPLRKSDFSL